MQVVELGEWHGLDRPLDGFRRQEMPDRVQHNTPILHRRLIINLTNPHLPTLNHLKQCLHGIHIPSLRRKPQHYLFLLHPNLISLLGQPLIKPQNQRHPFQGLALQVQLIPELTLEQLREVVSGVEGEGGLRLED